MKLWKVKPSLLLSQELLLRLIVEPQSSLVPIQLNLNITPKSQLLKTLIYNVLSSRDSILSISC